MTQVGTIKYGNENNYMPDMHLNCAGNTFFPKRQRIQLKQHIHTQHLHMHIYVFTSCTCMSQSEYAKM